VSKRGGRPFGCITPSLYAQTDSKANLVIVYSLAIGRVPGGSK